MPDTEIIEKLKGLVIYHIIADQGVKIVRYAGQGKDWVVFEAVTVPGGNRVAAKLYQSNPMFLLNEVDFDFLPDAGSSEQRDARHRAILDKLLTACERASPGLFFWHMKFVYARILSGLCRLAEENDMGVIDTATNAFQNEEFLAFARSTVVRRAQLQWHELDYWESVLNPKALGLVIGTLQEFAPQVCCFQPSSPTALLALVFSEGFFGAVSSEETVAATFGFPEHLDGPPIPAEVRLRVFLDGVDYRAIVPNIQDDIEALNRSRDQLRVMLQLDALDDSEWIQGLGDDFRLRYNAGRNTLLRGLPRFLRTLSTHLTR